MELSDHIRKTTVGIIEDEADERAKICEWIEESIALEIIFELDSGVQAFNLINEKRPDIILIDDAMPVKGGIAVIKELAAVPAEARPYIIWMSSMNPSLAPKFITTIGADDFLSKPVDKVRLLDRLTIYRINAAAGADPRECNDKMSIKNLASIREQLDIRSAKNEKILIEETVRMLLTGSYFSPNCTGYDYIVQAIAMLVKTGERRCRITTEIYPEVADIYTVAWRTVECGIRYAIAKAWETAVINDRVTGTVFEKYDRKPTNSQFLVDLRYILERKCMAEHGIDLYKYISLY